MSLTVRLHSWVRGALPLDWEGEERISSHLEEAVRCEDLKRVPWSVPTPSYPGLTTSLIPCLYDGEGDRLSSIQSFENPEFKPSMLTPFSL